MIGFVDVAIPLVVGILMIAFPQLFTKKPINSPSGNAVKGLLRMIGCVLLGVAAIFVVTNYFLPTRANVAKQPLPAWQSIASSAWQSIASTDGVLNLAMPGNPTVQTQNIESETGSIRSTKHLLNIDNGKLLFSINEIHYLNENLEFVSKECVDLMAKEVVSKSQYALIRERDIRIGSHEGREIGVRGADGYIVLMRLFFINRCAYQVKIVIPEKDIESQIVSRYFDSLSIKEPQPPSNKARVSHSDALQGIGRVTDVTDLLERASGGGNAEHPHPIVG